jgi:lipopolysaccharide export LptBFGC system permease protein LptF
MPLSYGAKKPLIMFLLVLVALCLICYFAGKGSAGYYAISVLSACIITWRWSDREAMPRWLYWALLTPVVVVVAMFAYFLAAGRIAA